MLLALPDIPLRTASFALEDRWLLWAQARLYSNRLVLSGWGLWERYWRRIPLAAIKEIEREKQVLTLQLEESEDVSLHVQHAKRWETALQMHREVYELGNQE